MAFEIESVKAREVLDSRGNPTVEAEVRVKGGAFGRACTPSGASTGAHEALELRDGGKRYAGKGVLKAVANVNDKIAKAIMGMDVRDQKAVDAAMCTLDGTEHKANLGANATTAVSMAVAKAAANANGVPLYRQLNPAATIMPVPMFNVLNGGKHAGTELSMQEFMVYPIGAKSFSEALQMGTETYHVLGSILKKDYGVGAKNVGDEGGYAPPFKTVREALEALAGAIEEAGYDGKIAIALDPAATSFYDEAKKTYYVDGKNISAGQLIDLYDSLAKTYPIRSIEDPLFEEDFDGFATMVKRMGSRVQIVGDDLLVTNVKRLQTGIDRNSITALLLKVNQIGTISEAREAAELAFANKKGVIVSHRSGETEDATIADLAVALGCGQIKTGAPARAERTAKYNQLLRIEDELGTKAEFPGENFRFKEK